MNASDTFSVALRFSLTMDNLCRAVAARIAGGAMQAVMIVMIWRRLKRIETQVQGLLARFLAGRLRVRAPGAPPGGGGRGGARPGGGSPGLPRWFGWLLQKVPYEAANFASQMRVVLAEPEMVALLRASPQARRVLRPLCRMLAIAPEILTPCGELQPAAGPERVAAGVDWSAPVVEAGSGMLVPVLGRNGWSAVRLE